MCLFRWRTVLKNVLGFLCIGLAFLPGCTEDNPLEVDPGIVPMVSKLVAPALVYNKSLRLHIVSVLVSDPQGPGDIEDVSYEIKKDGSASLISQGNLFDDGFNGDIVAADGVFSTLLTGSFASSDSGDFQITVFARDKSGNRSNSLQAAILVLDGVENLAPVILSATAPTMVPIDSTHDFPVTASVTDPEGLSNIKSVKYAFFPPTASEPTLEDTLTDSGMHGDLIAGDGTYTASLASTLFSTLNDYSLRIQAEDFSGNKSAPVVLFIGGRLAISRAPEVVAALFPRMVNAVTTNQIVVSADVTDPEGLADIDTVQFQALLPDDMETSYSPVHMFDDGSPGTSGDTTASDGRFSAIVPILETGPDPVDLRFLFTAKDKSGSVSQPFESRFLVGFSDAPYISDLLAPDQIRVDPLQDIRILITLDVRDPQGLSNITQVQFRSFRPDGIEANGSPVALFDDGNQDDGDAKRGDGIYSRFIFLLAKQRLLGEFRFVFEARDQEGNISNIIQHFLTVL